MFLNFAVSARFERQIQPRIAKNRHCVPVGFFRKAESQIQSRKEVSECLRSWQSEEKKQVASERLRVTQIKNSVQVVFPERCEAVSLPPNRAPV